jgi:hypothetical protein
MHPIPSAHFKITVMDRRPVLAEFRSSVQQFQRQL